MKKSFFIYILWNLSKTCCPVANKATLRCFLDFWSGMNLHTGVVLQTTYTDAQPVVPLGHRPTNASAEKEAWACDPTATLAKNSKQWCLHVPVVQERSADVGWFNFFFSHFVFGGRTCRVIASSRRDCQRFPFDDVAEKSESLQETNQWMNSLWNVSYAIKVINCLLAQQF